MDIIGPAIFRSLLQKGGGAPTDLDRTLKALFGSSTGGLDAGKGLGGFALGDKVQVVCYLLHVLGSLVKHAGPSALLIAPTVEVLGFWV